MTAIPVAFKSNAGRYQFLGTTTLTNCYAEALGPEDKGPISVLACDGSLSFTSVTDTVSRGQIYLEDLDVIYSVHTSAIWKITSAGTATRIGIIPGTDRCQLTRNQKATPQIVVKCAAGCYIVEGDATTQLSNDSFEDDNGNKPSPVSVTYLAGYVVYGLADGRFFISSLNEASEVDALDFATAEQSADKLIRAYADRGELLLFGQSTIEPWANTGAQDFPFELRGTSNVVQKGLLAADSVASLDNTTMWVGHDKKVYRLNGYQPVKISTPQVERQIQNDANQSAISATVYSKNGHDFYVITGTNWSWEYDAAIANDTAWHKRASYPDTKWRHDWALFAWGRILLSDRNSGAIYYLDAETYTEAGVQMVWTVEGPTIHNFPNGLRFDAVHFDVATGYGLTSPAAQGYAPLIMISWSDDGGYTFTVPRNMQIGAQGAYGTRVVTRRCGRTGAKGRVFKIAISDPVARSLVNIDAQATKLSSGNGAAILKGS